MGFHLTFQPGQTYRDTGARAEGNDSDQFRRWFKPTYPGSTGIGIQGGIRKISCSRKASQSVAAFVFVTNEVKRKDAHGTEWKDEYFHTKGILKYHGDARPNGRGGRGNVQVLDYFKGLENGGHPEVSMSDILAMCPMVE